MGRKRSPEEAQLLGFTSSPEEEEYYAELRKNGVLDEPEPERGSVSRSRGGSLSRSRERRPRGSGTDSYGGQDFNFDIPARREDWTHEHGPLMQQIMNEKAEMKRQGATTEDFRLASIFTPAERPEGFEANEAEAFREANVNRARSHNMQKWFAGWKKKYGEEIEKDDDEVEGTVEELTEEMFRGEPTKQFSSTDWQKAGFKAEDPGSSLWDLHDRPLFLPGTMTP
jgi:hypothetical protein